MGYMQAKNGPLTLFTDTNYASLGSSDLLVLSGSLSRTSTPTPRRPRAELRLPLLDGGSRRHVRGRQSRATPRSRCSQVAATGTRSSTSTSSLVGTADVDGLIVSGNRRHRQVGHPAVIDPFIGARLRYVPAAGEEIAIRGDVGGFGAGSKFTWQALATYNWLLCVEGPLTIDGYIGWRALSVDYETGEGHSRYEFDVLQHGPVLV